MNELETSIPKIDLFELARGLMKSMKHFWLAGMLMGLLFSGVFCFLTFISYTPMYQSSASFTVWLSNPFYASQSYYNTSAAEQMAKTFPYILTSGVLKEKVEEKLDVPAMPSISASALGNTNILTLTVTSTDPDLAYDVLNCIMEVYPEVAEFVVGPTTLSLINETGRPQHPSNPVNYTSSILKGAALSMALYLAMSLFYWITHQTVNDQKELAQLVHLNLLGVLPKVRNLDNSKLLPSLNDKYGFNESVRLLRVRVEKAMENSRSKVLMVTSTIANEGKTTVSINLAAALAQKGKKTLLVDCDLRNPSVASALGMENEIGVSEYLKGECNIKSVLHKINHENLYVIFGGKPVGNPQKLLNTPASEEFMNAARVTFDYIILDTPPCGMLSDAQEICALADCSLVTVRQDFAVRDQILEGVSILAETERPILGCVLNMAKTKIGKGSYSYYGYYGSYGSKNHEEKEVKEYA